MCNRRRLESAGETMPAQLNRVFPAIACSCISNLISTQFPRYTASKQHIHVFTMYYSLSDSIAQARTSSTVCTNSISHMSQLNPEYLLHTS